MIHKVSSSNISAIDYDEATQIMTVTFTAGSAYKYKNVPQSVVDSFVTAKSVGSYFFRNIKGVYEFERES